MAMKALSLLDIALWDIKAQRAQMPIAETLGGYRSEVPVMMVAGYFTNDTTPEQVAENLISYAKAGYSHVKVAASANVRADP